MLEQEQLVKILESVIFCANRPIAEKELLDFFEAEERPSLADFRNAISKIQESYQNRGVGLVEVASGFVFQAKQDTVPWLRKLWDEKPTKYSRALLETLALIAYRQPITRGEIEDIRGVSVSSSIFRTLDERNWIRVVGHKDVPGKPGLYATTKQFLDYFGLRSLEELPSLTEVLNLSGTNLELDLESFAVADAAAANVEEAIEEISEEQPVV
jgi:segregation and condensation protein B